MKHNGFTVVEIIVVIVAIAILATITVVSYAFMTDDAMDTKIRATVKTAGEAMVLYESRTGSKVSAGGYFMNSGGVDDSLVPGYLKTGYRDGLKSKNSSVDSRIFRWYTCNDGTQSIAVYASLNNPTAEDLASFQNIRTTCVHESYAPDTGNPTYNYAQLF